MPARKRNLSDISTGKTWKAAYKKINRRPSDKTVDSLSDSDELLSGEEEEESNITVSEKAVAGINNLANVNKHKTTLLKMNVINDFAVLLRNALLDPATALALRSAMEPLIVSQTRELTAKIDGLENKVSTQAKVIDSLKKDVDQLQQNEKRNHIRISGITVTQQPNSDMPMARVCRLAAQTMFREKMGIDVEDRDIEDAYMLGQNRDRTLPPTMIVKFTTSATKTNIMQLRVTKLKGIRPPIYINDELTKNRADVYRQTRIYAKEASNHGHSYNTWTRNGRILLKKDNANPVEILSHLDLN